MGHGRVSENMNQQVAPNWHYMVAVVTQVPAIVGLILIIVLFGHYRGGFSWEPKLGNLFNYHPLFMTLGMIIFYGDAILVYRILRYQNKLVVKIIHGTLLLTSLILASIGLAAIFDNHKFLNQPQLQLSSLHSWVGFTTIILFGLQWLCGLIAFLFPKLSEHVRTAYMPSHKFWGKTIFMFALIAFMMGVTEYSIFNLSKNEIKYQKNIFTWAAMMFLAFAVGVFYLVGDINFERPRDTNEHIPLTE